MEGGSEHFITFASRKEHYDAEACILWCFDARFSDLYEVFLAENHLPKSNVDLVKVAGGAQALAATSGSDHESLRSQIQKSIRLHHTNRIILMVHIDCGVYGGSKAFDHDHKKEWDHHVVELKRAAALIASEFPEIKIIETWIADFDGAHSIV